MAELRRDSYADGATFGIPHFTNAEGAGVQA